MAGRDNIRKIEVAKWAHTPNCDRTCHDAWFKAESFREMLKILALAPARNRAMLAQDMIRVLQVDTKPLDMKGG